MEWVSVISNGCILFTIIMFSIGIADCKRIIQQKTTQSIPFLPYLMTSINCASWITYGWMNSNFTVIFVNAVGFILQIAYIIVYLRFTSEKVKETKRLILFDLIFLLGWFFVTHVITDATVSIRITGFASCGITMLMFASPLSEINVVIQKKSTETISFPLTLASFVCASLWTAFGLFLHDGFIIIPNLVGILTSLFRFFLFQKYPSKSGVLPV